MLLRRGGGGFQVDSRHFPGSEMMARTDGVCDEPLRVLGLNVKECKTSQIPRENRAQKLNNKKRVGCVTGMTLARLRFDLINKKNLKSCRSPSIGL